MHEEVNPFMMMILANTSFVGESEMVEKELHPLPEQLEFGVGDIAILATANTSLESDFTVAKGLDAALHQDTYPDWQDRLLLQDYVLCELFSQEDTELSIGWVHRLKLLPVKKYRYRELRSWRKKGWPDVLPSWVLKTYQHYTDQIAEQAPDKVPVAVACPQCGKRNVNLIVTRRLTWTGRAGLLQIDGETRHVPASDPEMESVHNARLVCVDCKASADLTDEEWQLPHLTN